MNREKTIFHFEKQNLEQIANSPYNRTFDFWKGPAG